MSNCVNFSAGGGVPIGTIISFMGLTPPADYLACDGSTKNIADYPQLADFFEAQFGSNNYFGGDGTTTFGLPDLQGEFLRGTGTNNHTNQGSGGTVGQHQDGTEHAWVVVSDKGRTFAPYSLNEPLRGADASATTYSRGFPTYSGGDHSGTVPAYTPRPTNTSVLYCIKAIAYTD
jgi:microcystin-dependent protein